MSVAGERLKEAATLAAEGRLSATNKADLQENFESHATLAIQNIDEQAGTSPDTGARSALRFEAQLSEYGRVLGEVGGTENGAGAFVAAVRSQEDKIASVRMRAERRTTASSSPERAIAASRHRRRISLRKDLAAQVRPYPTAKNCSEKIRHRRPSAYSKAHFPRRKNSASSSKPARSFTNAPARLSPNRKNVRNHLRGRAATTRAGKTVPPILRLR